MKLTAKGLRQKLVVFVLTNFMLNAIATKPIQAQSEKNSRNSSIKTIEWNVLCNKFPLNSRCLSGPPEIVKILLAEFGAKDEWIRIDKTGNKVMLLHTRLTDGGIASKALDGIVSAAVPFPVPLSLYPKQWMDSQTTEIVFQPDNCQTNSQGKSLNSDLLNCDILGKNVLNLPQETNIRKGVFTLEYIEGELIRTIKFRIPVKSKSEVGLIVVE